MNDLIFNKGAIMGGVFAGYMFITNHWGVSILLNSGGTTNGFGGGSAEEHTIMDGHHLLLI